MGLAFPPAEGVRLPFSALPRSIVAQLERQLGGPIVSAETQPEGFSPGVAARVLTAEGRAAFLKAVPAGPNPDSPRIHRREIEILRGLPPHPSIPALLMSVDDQLTGWVVLVFEALPGRTPLLPWRQDELQVVVATLAGVHGALTPPPASIEPISTLFASPNFQRWGQATGAQLDQLDEWTRGHVDDLALMEQLAPEASAGNTLLHGDVRADNVVVDGTRAWLVDWPHARTGAAWVDMVAFAPSVEMQGGPPAEQLLAMHPAGADAPKETVDAVLASLAGMFSLGGLQPPPPGLPTVRAFQSAQGAAARAWLRRRLK